MLDSNQMRKRGVIPTRDIMGIKVLAASEADAVRVLDHYLGNDTPGLVTFLNAHISNMAAKIPALDDILNRSLVLNDGIGVGIASMLLHRKPFPANLQGTDFVPRYLRETRHAFRIYVLGAAPGVAERALDALRIGAPRHVYVGVRDGYLAEGEAEEVLAAIRYANADLVLIAKGTPRQELWADSHLIAQGGPSAICVGGLLDFLSNEKPRAPRWVRRLRSEWIFRLVIEPQRLWRRYLVGNVIFFARLIRACFRSRPA